MGYKFKAEIIVNNVHLAQPLTSMKLGGYKIGLLINFNTNLLKHGIKRVVNDL
ncbi:MAG: GxxExxY protein [Bacteroidota bacterium]